MSLLSHPRRVVGAVVLVGLLTGCAGSAASAPGQLASAPTAAPSAPPATATATPQATAATPAPTAATPAPTAAPARPSAKAPARRATTAAAASQAAIAEVDRVTAIGRRQYTAEVSGGKAHTLLRRVGKDPALLRALQSSDPNAVRAYVAKQFPGVWYHWHISRLRILQGSRTVVEVGVPFVVSPSQMTLVGAGGRTLGTLQTSIQDVIGFVRLMNHVYKVDVVVRGQRAADVRSSLPAAARAQLPTSGPVTLAGRRYQVRSFHEIAWNNEPVTVWILVKG
jgi:hypothetical protein